MSLRVAESGGQEGNQNSIKGRRWNAAINRALAKKSKASGIEELDRLAETFLQEVEASGIVGFKELADRLDGRPAAMLPDDLTDEQKKSATIVYNL